MSSELFAKIASVDLSAVPVVCRDRHISRKEQARLARELFKRLGFKSISVTTPNYSMASSVDVCVPHEPKPDMTGFEQFEHCTYSDMPNDVPIKAAMLRRSAAVQKIDAILDAAFPAHNNRSDYQTDYFDYCWSNH